MEVKLFAKNHLAGCECAPSVVVTEVVKYKVKFFTLSLVVTELVKVE